MLTGSIWKNGRILLAGRRANGELQRLNSATHFYLILKTDAGLWGYAKAYGLDQSNMDRLLPICNYISNKDMSVMR
jgi:hypothetical protein